MSLPEVRASERLAAQATGQRAVGTGALARSYVALGKSRGGGWLSV